MIIIFTPCLNVECVNIFAHMYLTVLSFPCVYQEISEELEGEEEELARKRHGGACVDEPPCKQGKQ